MTIRNQIIAALAILKAAKPNHPAIATAEAWLKTGTTYSNEDFDVCQALRSAMNPWN